MSTNADHPSCDPYRTDIGRRLLMCNRDELEVMDQLLARIEKGRDSYGFLDLEKTRDWDRELAEELLDVQVYRAVQAVKDKRTSVTRFAELFNREVDEANAYYDQLEAHLDKHGYGGKESGEVMGLNVEQWKCGWCGALLEHEHHPNCPVGKVAKW